MKNPLTTPGQRLHKRMWEMLLGVVCEAVEKEADDTKEPMNSLLSDPRREAVEFVNEFTAWLEKKGDPWSRCQAVAIRIEAMNRRIQK